MSTRNYTPRALAPLPEFSARYVGRRFSHLMVRSVIDVLRGRGRGGALLECVCLVCGGTYTVLAKYLPHRKTCARCAEAARVSKAINGGRANARRIREGKRTRSAIRDRIALLQSRFTKAEWIVYREYVGGRTTLLDQLEATEMVIAERRCKGCHECRRRKSYVAA